MATKDKQSEERAKLDEAPQAGGIYIVNGQAVNAEGKALDGWVVDSDGRAVQVDTATDSTSRKTDARETKGGGK